MTLPASTSALQPSSSPYSVQSKLLKATNVLVVDDEPAIGAAVRRVLGGHNVTLVTSGQEALDLLATGAQFHVVLSDLMMPRISGMEFYGTLVEFYPEMAPKVVFVTGGAFTAEANAFLDSVDNNRIEKRFDAVKLRLVIEKLTA